MHGTEVTIDENTRDLEEVQPGHKRVIYRLYLTSRVFIQWYHNSTYRQ